MKIKHVVAKLFLLLLSLSTVQAFALQINNINTGSISGKPAIIVQFDQKVTSVKNLSVVNQDSGSTVSSDWELSEDGSYQYITGIEIPAKYQIELPDELRGSLSSPKKIQFYELAPKITLLGQGPLINATGQRTIPVELLNVDGITLSLYRVDEYAQLFSSNYFNRSLSSWDAQSLRSSFTHITDLSFKQPILDINIPISRNISLPVEIENGWYIASIKPSNSFDNPKLFHFLLSDIGIQGKVLKEILSVQAIDLKANQPLKAGELKIIGKSGIIGSASLKDGFAEIAYTKDPKDVIIVENNGSFAVLPIKEVPLDLSDFSVSGRNWQDIDAFAFSNRNLFKPGENVPVQILLRSGDGELVTNKSLFAEVIKPDGKVSYSTQIPTQQNGFFSFEYPIPPSAPLGKWAVRIKANRTAEDTIGRLNFNVAEFVPERMDLELTLPEHVVPGTKLTGKASGRYLFGQPASNNKLQLSTTYHSITHFNGKYKDFYVGKKYRINNYRAGSELAVNLNKKGESDLSIPVIASDQMDGPAHLTLSAELLESGGATTTRVRKILVSENKSIVGIQPASNDVSYYSDASFSMLLLNSTGEEPLSGTINYRVERNRGGYYWEFNESSGWHMYRDNDWRLVSSNQIELSKQATQVMVPVEWGSYRIIATSPDKQETIYNFYAGWREGNEQIPVKPDQLSIKLDKENYLAGDDIFVTLSAPVNGTVNLELVGDKTYIQKVVNLDGKQKVQLELPDSLRRHDLYVTATLVNAEESYVQRRFAVQPIKLFRDDRRLDVKISAPEKLVPFEKQTIEVKVEGQKDKETFVVLSVADKGIINMSRYKVPNPFDWFYSQRRKGFDVLDLYSRQFEQRPSSFFLRHRYGGDTDIADSASKNNLVESKSFNKIYAPAKVNKQGKALVELDVPDYNGEVQVVATVYSSSRFGQDIEDVKVSAPVVAELSIPRFVSVGDSSQALLEVFNQTDKTLTGTVALSGDSYIETKGDNHFSLDLKPNEKVSLPVSIVGGQLSGMGELKLNLESEVYSAERSWKIPVRTPLPFATKVSNRILFTGDSMTAAKAFWDGLVPDKNNPGRISFSYNPQIDPAPYVEGLFRYPYGCAEQTTSTAYPWLMKDQELAPLKKKALGDRTEEALMIQALNRLEKYQHSNGGFGLWGKSSEEDAWLSVYVTGFLIEAQKQYTGAVSQSMLAKAKERLSDYIHSQQDADTKIYSAYVLANSGALSYASVMSHLAGLTPDNAISSTYLGAVYYTHGQVKKAREMFNAALYQARREHISSDNYYDSDISALAKMVSVVLKLEESYRTNEQFSDIKLFAVETILDKVNSRTYFSTQERFALSDAGFRLSQSNSAVDIVHNDSDVTLKQTSDFEIGDRFTNSGNKPIYASLTVQGNLKDEKQLKSTIKTKSVMREYFNTKGEKLSSPILRVGEKIIVHVSVTPEEKVNNALLVDYIPTGFVIENPDFTASAELLKGLEMKSSDVEMEEHRNDRYVISRSFRENRKYDFYYVLRAETPGKSEVPYLFVEDMYSPERVIFEAPGLNTIRILSNE